MRILLCFTFLFISISCTSQVICKPLIIHFRRQSQVDSFPIIFKGCDYIDSSIHIVKSGITNVDSLYFVKRFNHLRIVDTYVKDLNGLQGLDSVGKLEIHGNRYLKNLLGLKNLKKANSISVSSNDSISSLEGLKLDSVFSSLSISYFSFNHNNSVMKNLKGLRAGYINRLYLSNNINFEEVSGSEIDYLKHLRISQHHTLKNIADLNPKEIIEISYSNSIIDISELNELLKIPDYDLMNLRLYSLPNINNCAIDYICQNIHKPGFLTVDNNASGCNSIEEIKAACLLSTSTSTKPELKVIPNPVWDEVTISWQEWILPDSKILITNAQGREIHQHSISNGHSQVKFSVLNWPAGIYFYTVQSPSGAKLAQGKLVKI